MSTSLIEAKIGQGAVCGCLCPDVSLQLTRALFLRALVQEPPFSYQAPGSQVTGRGRGRWRQWLSCFLTHHHSSQGATLLSFELWLLSLIFSSTSVWSFLFLLGLLLLGKLRTPPYLGATSLTHQEQPLLFLQLPLEGWVPSTQPSQTAQGCVGTATATCSLPADSRRLNTPAQATI